LIPSPASAARHPTNSILFGGFFDPAGKKDRLEEINGKIEGQADFWTNPQAAAPVLKEKKVLEVAISQADRARRLKDDLEAALEMAREGDDDCAAEAERIVAEYQTLIGTLEVQSLLSGELDTNDAIITINAGAGGTESCDWASMLMRM
jgi:peptide chain release factor 2